ncbi:MAG: large subunit ribosomal protein L18 [Saprospiraceae bacterium]|jgi:large subunit ribosomal protein L18
MGLTKLEKRKRIQYRIRTKVTGTSERPRLSVFRSNKDIYCQLINDVAGVTLAAVSSRDIGATGTKKEQAEAVGKKIAEKALTENISSIVFDRGGYLYHGRIKALADGAREGGLQF